MGRGMRWWPAGPRRGGRDRLGQQEKEGELGCSEWGETSGPRREKEKGETRPKRIEKSFPFMSKEN